MANAVSKACAEHTKWQDAFKASTLKTAFQLHLSRPMLEFLSAVADDVQWDRAVWGSCISYPDNFIATAAALVKRGLIEEIATAEKKQRMADRCRTIEQMNSWSQWQLTPAGRCVVDLLKVTGLFLEQDAAIDKRSKR